MKQVKRILACAISLAVLATSLSSVASVRAAGAGGVGTAAAETIADRFKNPDNAAKGMFRFWLPDAAVEQDVLETQFQAIHDAGFGGVEIAHVPYSRKEGDLATNGWGTPAWQQALIKVYRAAQAIQGKFNVDVTVCTQWPTALDTIDPNDDAASQELQMAYSKITAAAPAALSRPAPALVTESGESFLFADQFVAATVAKVSEVTGDGLVLDYNTVTDVSNLTQAMQETTPAGIPDPGDPYCQQVYTAAGVELDVSGWGEREKLQDRQYTYQIDLTSLDCLAQYVPSQGEDIQAGDWVLFGFYRRGTGDTITPSGYWGPVLGVQGKSFATCGTVLDGYSQEGVNALIDYWNSNILNDELIELMRQQGGNLFEDSLEANNSTMFWNKNMLDSFQSVLGYDVSAYLPFLFCELNGIASSQGNEKDFVEDRSQIEDYLYINEHLKPLQSWAEETVGYGLRTQSYAHYGSLDQGLAAATVDVAEGETIEFGKSFDRFRAVATGVHTAGKTIISDETLASGAPYTMTWKQAVSTLNAEFAAGVNRIMVHGYSYPNTENMQIAGKDGRDTWPGWTTFATVGDCWGKRQISWQNIDIFSNYIARTEAVLQSGTAKADLAVLTDAFDDSYSSMEGAGDGRTNDLSSYTALLDRGFTYEVYTEGVLNLEKCSAKNGVLNPGGSGAKGIIVDNFSALQLETVQKLSVMAKNGLPIIFAGSLPSEVIGTDREDTGSLNGSREQLKNAVDAMLGLPNVFFVKNIDGLFSCLESLALTPSANYSFKNIRTNLHQDTDGSNYYYFYNDNAESATLDVTLTGRGAPYSMDAWTGEITPIACYQTGENAVSLELTIDGGEAGFIAVSQNQEAFGDKRGVWADQSNAQMRYTDRGIEMQVTQPGSYQAIFSDQSSKEVTVLSVPDTLHLTDWNLSIESWGPEKEANRTDLTASKKTTVRFGSAGLGLWKDLPATVVQLDELGVGAMSDVSGIGSYTASFNLAEDWDSSSAGYILQMAHSNDMVTGLTINGKRLHSVNQSSDSADIGPYLRPGENTLTIELTTTMSNRILYEEKDNPDSLFTALGFINHGCDFGLTSVFLTPYVLVPVYEEVSAQADRTILKKVIAYAQERYQSDEFEHAIADVQISFAIALHDAFAVDADRRATQAEIDSAWITLMNEIHKLGFTRGDKTSLGLLLETAQEFYDSIGRYTPATSQPFAAACTAAQGCYDDGNAVQEDVAAAESNLLQAMLNLRLKADKALLEAVLADAAQVDTSFYTAVSAESFDKTFQEAKTINDNPDASQAEVDSAAEALQAAIDALKENNLVLDTAMQGDSRLTSKSGNAKTGESAPVAAAVSLMMLAGVGFIASRKKR